MINSEVERVVNYRRKLCGAADCVRRQVREHERDLNGEPPSAWRRGRAPDSWRRHIRWEITG